MVMVPGPGVTTITTPIPSNVKPNTIRRYRLACWIVRITLSPETGGPQNPTALLLLRCSELSARLEKFASTPRTNCFTRLLETHTVLIMDFGERIIPKAFVDSQKCENICSGG